jgi:hypothetical protein
MKNSGKTTGSGVNNNWGDGVAVSARAEGADASEVGVLEFGLGAQLTRAASTTHWPSNNSLTFNRMERELFFLILLRKTYSRCQLALINSICKYRPVSSMAGILR